MRFWFAISFGFLVLSLTFPWCLTAMFALRLIACGLLGWIGIWGTGVGLSLSGFGVSFALLWCTLCVVCEVYLCLLVDYYIYLVLRWFLIITLSVISWSLFGWLDSLGFFDLMCVELRVICCSVIDGLLVMSCLFYVCVELAALLVCDVCLVCLICLRWLVCCWIECYLVIAWMLLGFDGGLGYACCALGLLDLVVCECLL